MADASGFTEVNRGRGFRRMKRGANPFAGASTPSTTIPPSAKASGEKMEMGRCEGMKHHMFHVAVDKSGVEYAETLKELKLYVGATEKKFTLHLVESLDTLVLVNPTQPAEPATETAFTLEDWKGDNRTFREKMEVYESFRATLYSIVLGQCSTDLKIALADTVAWPGIAAAQNGHELLALIRTLVFTQTDTQHILMTTLEAKSQFYGMQMEKTLTETFEKFQSHVEVLNHMRCDMTDPSVTAWVAVRHGRAADAPDPADIIEAKNRTIAAQFLRIMKRRHASYLHTINMDHLNGNDIYPATLQQAYSVLKARETENGNLAAAEAADKPKGTQATVLVMAGVNGMTLANIKCYHCHAMGHRIDQCPKKKREESAAAATVPATATVAVNAVAPVTPAVGPQQQVKLAYPFAQVELLLAQSRTETIPQSWVLLDNQSTVDVFCNSDLLDDIHDSDHPLAIHCNAGIAWAHQRGTLPGYNEVWFYPNGIANILSLHNVLHRFRVTLDTQRGKYFTVHGLAGKDSRFTVSESGLFFYDTSANESGMALVTTVEGNKANYTRTDVLRAEYARELQSKLNHPSDKDFIDIVNDNSLRSCPVTKRDIVAARAIHGPCVESLQGKTVRRPPHKVSLSETPTLPAEVHKRYNKITICGDIMKLNNLSFLVTISRNLQYGTVHYLPNKRDSTVMKALKKILSEYQYGGFKVVHAVMDGGFDGIEDELMKYGVMYNGTGRDEHVGEVERYIRTVKSKCRCTYNSLKFKHLPCQLVVEVVK